MEFKNFLKELVTLKDERKNMCDLMKSHNLPIILFGAGDGAKMLADALSKYDVQISGYAVDDKYYKENSTFLNCPVYRLSDILEKPEKYVMVNALDELHGNKMTFLQNKNLISYTPSMIDMSAFGVDYAISKITAEDVLNDKEKFSQTFEFLSDELSKKIMITWLKQKIVGDCMEMLPLCDDTEYFNELATVALDSMGGYVDCGAYDGETVERFINWSNGKYTKIFAFEPDSDNFALLKKFTEEKSHKNILIFNSGVWDEKTQLCFTAQSDMGSSISDEGSEKIDVVKIDDIVGGEPISLIKMDIEGSELKALQGARETINKNKPTLEVCVYHRTEDLITIPQFIKSIHPNYKIYLRKHSFCSEFNLVLYAVP